MTEIVLASSNKGKLAEIQKILSAFDISITPQSDLNVSDADETGLTFIENAIIKARHASAITGKPAIADDSGLEVDLLNGAPGIYSSRYAGEDATDQENVEKLLDALDGVSEDQRSARFYCIIIFIRHQDDPTPLICEGSWAGTVMTQPRGTYGFGYDPVFYVPTHQCSSAELPPDVKNTISHRGQALRALIQYLPVIQTHLTLNQI
ncbi:MAG: RdgB/HAM1 family non-canonical purine NTP pyrophosphatase [Gammaproteobacteria bacterium]